MACFAARPPRRGKARRSLNPVAMRVPLGNPRRVLEALEPFARTVFRPSVLVLWACFVVYGAFAAAAHWDVLAATAAKLDGHAALCVSRDRRLCRHQGRSRALSRSRGAALGMPRRSVRHHAFPADTAAVRRRVGFRRVAQPAPAHHGQRRRHPGRAHDRVGRARGLAQRRARPRARRGIRDRVRRRACRRCSSTRIRCCASTATTFSSMRSICRISRRAAPATGESSRRRALLRVPVDAPLVPARGERPWLIAYAPLSWLYRVGLSMTLTVWVGSHSFVLGVLAGCAFLFMLVRPAVRGLVDLVRAAALGSPTRTRADRGRSLAGLAALVLVLTLAPMPYGASVPGVVWLPENARVRAGTEGFVAKVVAHDGARVAEGRRSARASERRARDASARSSSRRASRSKPSFYGTARRDPGTAANVAEELGQRARGARARRRADRGPHAAAGCAGHARHAARERSARVVRAARARCSGTSCRTARRSCGSRCRRKTPRSCARAAASVQARLASAPGEKVPGTLERDAGGAVSVLPSAALSTRHGGTVVTDPEDQQRR